MQKTLHFFHRTKINLTFYQQIFQSRNFSYKPKSREYFYYVDLNGKLYHMGDRDAPTPSGPMHIRDERLMNLFFKNIKKNDTAKNLPDFPYLSICAGEYNYVKAADRPIVFIHLSSLGALKPGPSPSESSPSSPEKLYYGSSLELDFRPGDLFQTKDGRLYHPAPVGKLGLIRSNLAIVLGKNIQEENGQLFFDWKGTKYPIKKLPPNLQLD